MTGEKAVQLLHVLQATAEMDAEDAHVQADQLLLELLEGLGYDNVVAAWKEVKPKYYS